MPLTIFTWWNVIRFSCKNDGVNRSWGFHLREWNINMHERGTLRVALVFLSWRRGATACASHLIKHDSTNHINKDAKTQFQYSMCVKDRKQVCGSVQACVWVRLRHFLVWNAALPPHPSLSLLCLVCIFSFLTGFFHILLHIWQSQNWQFMFFFFFLIAPKFADVACQIYCIRVKNCKHLLLYGGCTNVGCHPVMTFWLHIMMSKQKSKNETCTF